ncbi:MAG: 30S ribosomal protein S6 [Candidatus Poribacteria bacterium]
MPRDSISGYETTFLTKPEISDEVLKSLQERLTNTVGQFNGDVVLTEDWGRRKLAYSIKKETRGHYSYVVYTGGGGIVQEIERQLRLNEHVLRFLTVHLGDNFDKEAFKKERVEMQDAAKRREAERESRREERFERRGHYDMGGRGGREYMRDDMFDENISSHVEE